MCNQIQWGFYSGFILKRFTSKSVYTIDIIFPVSDDYCLDSSGSESLDSPDPQPVATTPDPENTYQCLKWSPFKPDEWCNLYDDASQV